MLVKSKSTTKRNRIRINKMSKAEVEFLKEDERVESYLKECLSENISSNSTQNISDTILENSTSQEITKNSKVRTDVYGTEIKKKGKKHKISFPEENTDVVKVESYKRHNSGGYVMFFEVASDLPSNCGGCKIF